ncbi:MAG: sensor histidine kinase [Anaerovoracaceae bacterium]|jgi:signal transduction histidine kinase
MISFFLYPQVFSWMLMVGMGMSVIGQTTALVYEFYRYGISWKESWSRDVLEVIILIQVVMIPGLLAHAGDQVGSGYLLDPSWPLFRYIVFALLTAMVIVNTAKTKIWYILMLIPVVAVTLPVVEQSIHRAFPALVLISTYYLTVRSIHMIILCRREIRTHISAISVYLAIDSLQTAILFCKKKGSIILINSKMIQVMNFMAGTAFRNGKEFYEEIIVSGNCLPGCEKIQMEGEVVYRLPDGRVWLFTKTDLIYGTKTYVQLTASDVTKQWEMIQELNRQRDRLQTKSEELKEAIENISKICHKEESIRIKSRFHDVLGQRIAILLRSLREGEVPDEKLLSDFAYDFLKDIREGETKRNVESQIETMRRVMKTIGVSLHISGEMPEEAEAASVFADILMEATTNAVRHGLATDIYISAGQRQGEDFMTIRNNGRPPSMPIVEGGGIGQMRKRVETASGTLDITQQPEYELSISIPKGGKDDEGIDRR